jgi:hypothetical protein
MKLVTVFLYLVVVLWFASSGLNLYGAYRMVQVRNNVNYYKSHADNSSVTSSYFDSISNDLYYASRVEGIGCNVIFAVATLFLFANGWQHIKDFELRFRSFWKFWDFWLGFTVDVVGVGLLLQGFTCFGSGNPQDGTSYVAGGLFCISLGSLLILKKFVIDSDGESAAQNLQPNFQQEQQEGGSSTASAPTQYSYNPKPFAQPF